MLSFCILFIITNADAVGGTTDPPVHWYACNRPRRRWLEAFTTGSEIIRPISRRIAIFPAAAARPIFDGDWDAANQKKIRGDTAEFPTLWVPQ